MKPIRKSCRNTDVFPVAGIIIVITLGVVFSAIITDQGLGIEGDGYYYINAARVIAAHWGAGVPGGVDRTLLKEITDYYVYLMELWPIFYPALLAAVGFSADPYPAGRWLHLTFPVVIGLLLWLIVYANKHSHKRAFLAVALVLLSPHILRLNCFVFSEMPFLILQLLSLSAVGYYLRNKGVAWLIAAVFFIGLAGLTRYIGVVMALALGITVWRTNPGRAFFRRLMISIACVLLGVLPGILYMFSSVIYGKTLYVAGRSLVLKWPLVKAVLFFKKSVRSVELYLSPLFISGKLQILFVLLAAAAIIILFIHQAKKQRRCPPAANVLRLQGYITACVIIYVLLTSFLALFLDHMLCFTGITPRHFAPLFVWLVVLVLLTGPAPGKAGECGREPLITRFAGLFVIILLATFLAASFITALQNRGIAAEARKVWQESTVLEYVRKNEGSEWLVSNMPGELFHYLRKPVFALPSHYDFFKAQENPYYAQQMSQIQRLLHQHNGLVLYFNPYLYLPHEAAYQATTPKECMDMLDLEVLYQDKTGMIMNPRPARPKAAGNRQ